MARNAWAVRYERLVWWVLPLLALSACAEELRTGLSAPDGAVTVLRPDGSPAFDGGPALDAGPTDDGGFMMDAGPTGPFVRFEEPAAGARLMQDTVEGRRWAARVTMRVRAAGVARVEFWAEERTKVGEASGPPWEVEAGFTMTGERRLVALGLDAAGVEVARDEVRFTIAPPTDDSCHAMLDALGLDWSVAPPNRGIADPVWVQPLVRGVRYRYVESSEPSRMLADCQLAVRLAEVADLVKGYGLDEVVHIGIYNYRCIGGGTPETRPGCTLSQHAFAQAIDLHAFRRVSDGTEYNVETDWVVTSGDTCPGRPSGEADRILHEIACTLWSDRIFHIVLTPNYNSAHRSHFHVDLTEGANFIKRGDLPAGVDPQIPDGVLLGD